jgi:hypothetical protein
MSSPTRRMLGAYVVALWAFRVGTFYAGVLYPFLANAFEYRFISKIVILKYVLLVRLLRGYIVSEILIDWIKRQRVWLHLYTPVLKPRWTLFRVGTVRAVGTACTRFSVYRGRVTGLF